MKCLQTPIQVPDYYLFAILRVLATPNNALLICNELQLISHLKKPTIQRVTDACLEIFFRLILLYIIMFFSAIFVSTMVATILFFDHFFSGLSNMRLFDNF